MPRASKIDFDDLDDEPRGCLYGSRRGGGKGSRGPAKRTKLCPWCLEMKAPAGFARHEMACSTKIHKHKAPLELSMALLRTQAFEADLDAKYKSTYASTSGSSSKKGKAKDDEEDMCPYVKRKMARYGPFE